MADTQTPRDSGILDVEKGESSDKPRSVQDEGNSEPAPGPSTMAAAPIGEKPSEGEDEEEQSDPNAVFWDGPDDPQNPMNWTNRRKWLQIVLLSALTVVT